MQPLAQTSEAWHEFYTLLGTASATMIGLLFVAASVGSRAFSSGRRAPLRLFLSASVVNFSLVLAVSLVVMSPVANWLCFGLMILACGLFGLTHSCLAWRDTLQDGLITAIDLEDRSWYLTLPIVGYLIVIASGVTLACRLDAGFTVLALSAGLLLTTGIHNAWDITVWIMTRRSE